MYSVQLQWKSGFSVDLPSIEAWVKTNAGANFVGSSADTKLTLWFSQDPSVLPSTSSTSMVTVSAATHASATVNGATVSAVNAGAAGNIHLQADPTALLSTLIATWNAANPSNQLNLSGPDSVPASVVTLTGGADAVTQQVTIQTPTGAPSQAQIIQAHWDSLDEQSAEAVAYTNNKTAAQFQAQAAAAIAFGNKLLAQFAGQNLQLGITAAGKTKAVRVAMQDVTDCLTTGSLIEAIAELKAVPTASYDSTFITAARLLAAVNQLETFCGLPLSTSLS